MGCAGWIVVGSVIATLVYGLEFLFKLLDLGKHLVNKDK